MEELGRLFGMRRKDGRLTLLYGTEVYFGTLRE